MRVWAMLAIAVAVAALVVSGAAQSFAASLDARRQAPLQQMLARPNDLDLAFEYAKLSTEAGDYEGAISTLERMLIYAPNTRRLQARVATGDMSMDCVLRTGQARSPSRISTTSRSLA
jgi:tetratricopeptide (TPR) repeat protein